MKARSGLKTTMPKLYNSWRGMRDRCNREGRSDAHCYSGKGIRICPEWDDVRVFCEWALANGYEDGLTIDRIDSNKGYSPENCRWVDRKVQARNISRNRIIEFDGRKLCVSEWSELTGISQANIYARINKLGWPIEKALSIPAGVIPRGSKPKGFVL